MAKAKKQTKKLLQEGGLNQEGGTTDPVSWNDVPVGSIQKEVRDDIPAQLSEGEFVFPADVVRFIGLDNLMKLRQEAKAGLAKMDRMGQMGNSEEAVEDDTGEFDTDIDYGFTPVTSKPKDETTSSIDPKLVEDSKLEIAKVKSDVSDIKSMMNEVMQIVAEKDSVNKEIQDADTLNRFKEIEKIVLPFLYNLSKSNEPYIHWPNRGPIIKAQMDKLLKLTRG